MQPTFAEFVRENWGVLSIGSHANDDRACVFEAWNAYRGQSWTDSPAVANCFDLRQLNDMAVSDALRTRWLVRVLDAYQGSLSWPLARQIRTVERLGVLTVQRIVSELPGLPQDLRRQCASVTSLAAAQAAAQAATEAAAAVEAAVEEAGPLAEATWAVKATAWAVKATAEVDTPVVVKTAAYAAMAAAKVAADAALAAAEDEVAALFVTACTLWLEAAA